MLSLSGHIGTKASALVDGQLSPAEEERAWSHVLTCPGCRRLSSTRAGPSASSARCSATPRPAGPPPQLLGSLYAVDALDAWATVGAIEKRSRRAAYGGRARGRRRRRAPPCSAC